MLFELEPPVIEFAVVGLDAEFALRLQLAAAAAVELELVELLELLSCAFGLGGLWRFGLGVDLDRDFIIILGFDVELKVEV